VKTASKYFWLGFCNLPPDRDMRVTGAGPDAGAALVLLCHKISLRVPRWQHGQRGSARAMARAIATRTDVMELVT
jgi:hypothetical protein